jgi:hypothetical protein
MPAKCNLVFDAEFGDALESPIYVLPGDYAVSGEREEVLLSVVSVLLELIAEYIIFRRRQDRLDCSRIGISQKIIHGRHVDTNAIID